MEATLSLSLRPSRLEDVIGHSRVVASLRTQLAESRLAKGWIFSGPPGVGKTTLARILANLLNGGEEADIHEANCADENGVDSLRALVSTAEYHPLVGKYKIYILDEAQQLTAQAQNVLLKPLESTSGSAIFFFCTTEPTKLIPALRSRCLPYALSGFTAAELDQLAQRAFESIGRPMAEGFGAAAVKAGITGPREALMSLEKVAGGMSLKDALARPEHEALYADIAKSVLSGNWTRTQQQLAEVKSADVGGLRSVLAAFMRSNLVRESPGPRLDAISSALIQMGQVGAHEQGVAYAVTVAILYRLGQKLSV